MAALSFVYTYDAVVKEQNFPASIVALVNLGQLNNPATNAQGTPGRPNESVEEACLRHLRNCFAHGRFVINGTPNNPQITLRDHNQVGAVTFDAHCDAADVFDLAERVLVEAHNIAAAIAQQAAQGVAPLAPTAAGAAAPPATAAPPAPTAAPPPAAAVAPAPVSPAAAVVRPAGNQGGSTGTPP